MGVTLSCYDTMMQHYFDTTFLLLNDFFIKNTNFENDELMILFESRQPRKQFLRKIVLYDLRSKVLAIKDLNQFQEFEDLKDIHHFGKNIIFTVSEKKQGDKLFILENEATVAHQFDFTKDFFTKVLNTYADGESKHFLTCISSEDKTFFFKLDANGKSVFANVIDNDYYKSSDAFISKVGESKYMTILRSEEDWGVVFRSTLVDGDAVKYLPYHKSYFYIREGHSNPWEQLDSLTSGVLLSSVPQYTSISPVKFFHSDKYTAVTMDFYKPEYYQYYNGYYYDTRFYGYRYDHADVLIYNNDGTLAGPLQMSYDDSHNLHSTVISKTKVAFLDNGEVLLYYMDSEGFTTQLLNSEFKVIDPVRTQEIPLRSRRYAMRNAEVDIFVPWFGRNNFILGAYQYSKDSKNSKVGYIINKLKFE